MAVEDFFDKVVAVEWDQNRQGEFPDYEGGVSPIWSPLAGFEALPCRVCDEPSQRNRSDLTEDVTTATILFPLSPALPDDKALRFKKSTGGNYYYSEGKIIRPGGAQAMYLMCRAREGAIPES